MRSAKQRNNLIEYAKTKHFSVGNDHFQVTNLGGEESLIDPHVQI